MHGEYVQAILILLRPVPNYSAVGEVLGKLKNSSGQLLCTGMPVKNKLQIL
jgi:hypothetical protein